MKKNVASQSIGAQMITISDGSDFTGTVTAEVTVDGGTKTAGGGSVTHEGEGYHSYAPTQAETNGDHIAFSFAGTGAISATVQVFTAFPQTVDNDVSLAAILTDTGTTIPAQITALNDVAATDIVSSGAITTSGGAVSSVTTVATTTALTNVINAASVVASVSGNVDGSVGSVTGHTPQTGDNFARIGVNGAGLSNINLPNQTMDITGNLSGSVGSVTGGATSAAQTTAQNDLDIITGADGVNLLSGTQASIDAIEADTNELQGDWLNGGRLDLILDARMAEASISTTGGAVDTVTDVTNQVTADSTAINGDSIAAANLAKSAIGIESGAAIAGTLSTTQMTTDLTETTDDHYNGRIIVWTTGVLKNQATDITDYTGSTKLLTFTATTEAPNSTDEFVIL